MKEDGVTYLETAVSLAMPSDSVMSRLYVGLADCYKMAFQSVSYTHLRYLFMFISRLIY